MVQTTVIPQDTNFAMSVALPNEFIGKKVHVLFYIDDEISQTKSSILKSKKPSDFFGTLSEVDAKKMHDYVIKSRNELANLYLH